MNQISHTYYTKIQHRHMAVCDEYQTYSIKTKHHYNYSETNESGNEFEMKGNSINVNQIEFAHQLVGK